jgi:hypothetical protein
MLSHRILPFNFWARDFPGEPGNHAANLSSRYPSEGEIVTPAGERPTKLHHPPRSVPVVRRLHFRHRQGAGVAVAD